MDPLTLGLIGFGGGMLGKVFNSTPDWSNLNSDAYNLLGDYKYDNESDYGQSIARENMGRYGFGGGYNTFLRGEMDRMRKDEMSRILKLTSNMTPGMASFRGGAAAQGLGGGVSNVIARQQREQSVGKAMDAADQMYESSASRLAQMELSALQASEGMRYGSSQDLMRSTGQASEATNASRRFNTEMLYRRDEGNVNRRLSVDQFNTQGQFQADTMRFNKWNDIFGDIAGMGSSMLGQWAGAELAKSAGPVLNDSDVGFLNNGGWKSDGRGGWDWKAPADQWRTPKMQFGDGHTSMRQRLMRGF